MKSLFPAMVIMALTNLNFADVMAQNAESQLSGPLIQKHAATNSKWIVTTRPGEIDSPAPPPPAPGMPPPPAPFVVTFTKSEQILDAMMVLNGKTFNVWNIGSAKVVVSDDGKTCAPVVPANHFNANPFDINLTTTDFPGSEWITASSYVGVVTFEGKKCLQFKSGEKEAYVDLETRLPVGIQAAGETHLYQFVTPPAETLTPPPAVQKYLDQQKNEAARYKHVPLAPF